MTATPDSAGAIPELGFKEFKEKFRNLPYLDKGPTKFGAGQVGHFEGRG